MAGAPAVLMWRSTSCAGCNRHAPCRHADTAVICPGADLQGRASVLWDQRNGMICGLSMARAMNDGSPRRIPPFLYQLLPRSGNMRIDIDKRGIVYKRNLTLKGGLGFKRGEYLRILKPGKHSTPWWHHVEQHDVFDPFRPKETCRCSSTTRNS